MALKLHFLLSTLAMILLVTFGAIFVAADIATANLSALLTHLMVAVWIFAGWFYWRAYLWRRKAAERRSASLIGSDL